MFDYILDALAKGMYGICRELAQLIEATCAYLELVLKNCLYFFELIEAPGTDDKAASRLCKALRAGLANAAARSCMLRRP